jgi:hypothetical protein
MDEILSHNFLSPISSSSIPEITEGGVEIKKTAWTGSFAVFILFLFISNQFFCPHVLADEMEYPYQEYDERPKGLIPFTIWKPEHWADIINYIIENPEALTYIFQDPLVWLGYSRAMYPGKHIYSAEAKEFTANKTYIEIGYNESVTIQIGKMNLEEIDKNNFTNITRQNHMHSQEFTFLPTDFPGGKNESWSIVFDPPVIRADKLKVPVSYRVNVTIKLTSPPIEDKAIQSGILRIRQAAVQVFGDFWDMEVDPITKLFYVLNWGTLGGTVNQPAVEKMRYVDILVKVKQYHKVYIRAPKIYHLNPNQVKAIPIKIKNVGNYKDTIGFQVVSVNQGITILDPIDVTLKPGEEKETLLGVGVDPNLIDYGTLHTVRIKTFSLANPNVTIAEQVVIIKTEGFYISEYTMSIFFVFFIFLILIALFFSFRRRKSYSIYFEKPDKPWELPEEKKYLEKLKKKDEKKYKETLDMMINEYESALLWFKYYRQSIIEETKKEQFESLKIAKRKKRDEKIRKKEKDKKVKIEKQKHLEKEDKKEKLKKSEIKEIKQLPKGPAIKEKDSNIFRREQEIIKVRRSQEKQRKRLGKIGDT